MIVDEKRTGASENADVAPALEGDALWIHRARTAYTESTDYYESSIFPDYRANLAHFRSEHAPGSKYLKASYAKRSRVFRPKPRSAVRSLDAVAATALFTNDQLLETAPLDPSNELQIEASRLFKAIGQYHLEHSIPWFLTAIGAYQDTNVAGVCISKQYWDLRKIVDTYYEPAFHEDGITPVMDEDGVPLGTEHQEARVLVDKPAVDLIALEKFRFDPGCDWRDPAGTSPYLIEIMDMYASDVMAMADDGWRRYTLGELVAHGGMKQDGGDTVRDAREGKKREDPKEVDAASEYQMLAIHFNIFRDNVGEDWCYYTVGTDLLLTDPVKLREYNPLEREMYRVGFSNLETHKNHPTSTIGLNRPLTELNNDITNQRMDNVQLALNRRYKVLKDAGVDLAALMRNVPGGGVVMDDLDAVQEFSVTDVTQSSYVEQDRASVEMDELLGTFSQASVNNNRNLNETVGGMRLMSDSANQVQELGLKTWVVTWVQPVLRSVIKLIALYETDETIINLAAGMAEIDREVDDELMLQDMVVKVNVGMGNTNPEQKMKRMLQPIETAAQFPEMSSKIDWDEVVEELFTLAGFGDGSRFLLTADKLKEKQDSSQPPTDPRVQVQAMKQELEGVKLQLQQRELDLKEMDSQRKFELGMAKVANDQNMSLEKLYAQMGIERERMMSNDERQARIDQTKRDIAALQDRRQEITQRLQAQNLSAGYDTY